MFIKETNRETEYVLPLMLLLTVEIRVRHHIQPYLVSRQGFILLDPDEAAIPTGLGKPLSMGSSGHKCWLHGWRCRGIHSSMRPD